MFRLIIAFTFICFLANTSEIQALDLLDSKTERTLDTNTIQTRINEIEKNDTSFFIKILAARKLLETPNLKQWPYGLAKAYNLNALLYASISQLDSSINFYLSSIKISEQYQSLRFARLTASNYADICKILVYQNEINESTRNLALKGLEICKDHNIVDLSVLFYNLLGILSLHNNEIKEGNRYWAIRDSIVKKSPNINESWLLTIKMNYIGESIVSGKHSKGLAIAEELLTDSATSLITKLEIRNLLVMSYYDIGIVDSALYWFHQQTPYLEELPYYLKENYYYYGGSIYELLGDYKTALEFNNEYIVFRDSIDNKEKHYELGVLLNEFEKNKEILKKDHHLKLEQEIAKERLVQRNILLILLLMTIVTGAIIYLQRRNKLSLQWSLYKKNKELLDEKLGLKTDQIKNQDEDAIIGQKQAYELYDAIESLLYKEKIYLNKNLSLDLVCEKLKTNKNYIHYVFKTCFNKPYSTIINELRVLEAQELLSQSKTNLLTIESIGLQSGFSSRSTFYKNFKSYTGLTPMEYLNRVNKKES